LWLWKLKDEPPSVIDVVVPESRKVLPRAGLRVHRRRALDQDSAELLVHPAAQPRRLRVEEAVLDHCDSATAVVAIDLMLRATQRRLSTADRLRRSIDQRPRQRWRSLLLEVLTDVKIGVASPLELRYLRDVEKPHDLPSGTRNEPEKQPRRSNRYRDVRYRAWHVIVELDGRAAHPVTEKHRDMGRDNVAAVAGDAALRYGWLDVVGVPCAVASQVAAVLRRGGWTGRPRPCGPRCAAWSLDLPAPPVRITAGDPVA
jgi:very-short-patch-repair endonuclease